MLLQDLRRELPGFARRAPIVLAINTLIGVMMWLRMRPAQLDVQLVYSHAIGTISWLLIDVGRFFVGPSTTPHRFPHGWKKLPFLASGVLIGYVAGTSVGDAYSGRSTWELVTRAPVAFLSLTLGSLIVGSIIVYIFYSRGELAHHRAEAEAARRQAAENQLKLLESQLEPHMLFNTLANLRALIGVDPPRAQAMLDRMIAFLRATLNASRTDMHPLQLEFARLADYLELMRIRMGDRLAMQLDLPEALTQFPVPPLLLQPLVENAIKHGLEPSVEGGRIEVSARRRGDELVLTVRDTGVGAPSAGASQQGAGFGLDQVRKRIATVYGAQASLSMAPATDGRGGMHAVVTLPVAPFSSGAAAQFRA
ncbi:histidine kinase [Schlegelella sp. S2-27]|uniref:Histidine kinase n=1 Tax=Caldimonas mangrovi TaxID=2944811 RepID=A0ABT0YHH0_9BURK|nr:histidine kinase [Caldimonas mangrovi]MCM5678165.1 histidine kinase [Caldimonas mangrovi]